MVVGFVGFGEACSAIAAGLYSEGVDEILCFDVMQNDERFKESFDRKIAACCGVKMETAADVAGKADIIIAAIPSNCAVDAAIGALEGVRNGLVYMDVSTATPKEKRQIAEMIEAKGGLFVDGAMMGPVLSYRHKVPMLICGKGALSMKEKMAPYHMAQEIVDGDPGTATSIKFIRSITAKGLSCLLIESLEAAQRFGVEDMIVDSLLESFGPQFNKVIDNYVSGAILHSVRRLHEMENVVDFLKSEDLPYKMAEATKEKFEWIIDEKIKESFGDTVPRDWKKVLEGWNL